MYKKPEEKHETMYKPDYTPEIDEMHIVYKQDPDGNDSSDSSQRLTFFTEDAGEGKYYVLETERWAFDTMDDVIEVLKDFIDRAEG